ncbi:diacylglycerol kinase [bacterium]|nr:diacylglycerol kinase [bacterium]
MESNKPDKKSPILRLWYALIYSLSGMAQAWRDEQAFRQEVVLSIVLIPCAFLLPIDLSIRLILILSMIIVLIVELINSSVEAVTDLVTKDLHDLAKKAKDCTSAAVLISLVFSGAMWALALYGWLLN